MNDSLNNQEADELSLRELIEQYSRYWYLFVIGVIIALAIAFIYLRYTPQLYQSKATIIIKDEKTQSPLEMAAFSQFGSFLSRFKSNQIDNELAIFNSKRLISETVKELQLNIKYEVMGNIKTSEIYGSKPFEVKFQSFNDSLSREKVPTLYIEILSDSEFIIEDETRSSKATYKFGESISLIFGDITVLPNLDYAERFESYINKTIIVSYKSVEDVALSFQDRVNILNADAKSNVVELSIQTQNKEKGEDFLNELVHQYNKDAVQDRNEIAKKTSAFIESRLQIITRELDSVETNKEDFKSTNRLTDIQAEAQITLENASEFNKRQLDVSTQMELSSTMIDYMKNSSDSELLPSNIGISNENVGSAVNNYNELILYRNKLLQTSTPKNPVVKSVNEQITQMRGNILGSLENSKNALKIAMKDLNIQENIISSKISQVPAKEKIFRGIERQQSIKEKLYLFLLQQREEASIALAATSDRAKIVDSAYGSQEPVSPKKPLIYLGALLAGLLIPFGGIYGFHLLSTKVNSRKDVEKHIKTIPIIGEIPKVLKGDSDLIQHNDRSIMAEAYRILRTNLQYLFINKLEESEKGKTLIVTSTIKGEGKTFVAFNLALTLALTGKKVVLVGADIRNPQLQRYLPEHLKTNKGLTEYIVHSDMKVEDIISQSEYNENLSIVLSGAIPPNPAELLMQKRTTTFIDELRNNFDYIIMDTAPSMLVTDTILINKLADITLYVVRAGYTDKRLLDFPQDAIKDGRLSNVAIVLNNVKLNNFGYGNKYGYAYSQEERSFLQRVFNR
ncbi:GumC family protein [Aequorivita lipolytica]|uniref:non-specific protein-tyrosine kinase n=1 Tax=Aequorivita lipolytica TaxID=153267 RepID=A0A5C6YLT3_9FLAO|nr:polysaccharide biosynthesis tyrosine autokinase [Aequorivita lipolytica]TXD68042.1 polysaccharide biosynthesis tyrosine autokinase [Aequorivita lipolytica]SRX53664.1 Tyrosine-protein kinase ptk [Aequorivita lipolytica]